MIRLIMSVASCFAVTLFFAISLPLGPLTERSAAEGRIEPFTRLGIDGTRFTINDKPAFLLGVSYYGALGAPDETVQIDIAQLQKHGFNWVRVWATWAAFGEDVSAVDGEGNPREPFLKRLQRLVATCGERGIIVDVTLSRGSSSASPSALQSQEAHRRAVETLVTALKSHRNWCLDLANERNIKDKRFTSFADLKELRDLARKLDANCLVTASHGGDISKADLNDYLNTVHVDYLCPHRPRTAASPSQTEAMSIEYQHFMKDLGRTVPISYQEPFRRDYGDWQPQAEDFITDLKAARSGGAAGWCWHNGANRSAHDGQPRRSFDLREKRLFQQLDEEDARFLTLLERNRQDGGGFREEKLCGGLSQAVEAQMSERTTTVRSRTAPGWRRNRPCVGRIMFRGLLFPPSRSVWKGE
jgi:hypothetical protein